MDLFSTIVDPPPMQAPEAEPPREPDEWDDIDFGEWEPTEAETEAAMLGSERAGMPSWSKSASRNADAFTRLLAAFPDAADLLRRVEAEYYRSARRRKVALLAMEREFSGEGE